MMGDHSLSSELVYSNSGQMGKSASSSIAVKPTLASVAAELALLLDEIDSHDGEITADIIARFDDASLAVADKCDRWIGYLDSLKAMSAALKERKDRAAKAQKSVDALQARLKDYLKGVLATNPGVPFKGSEGSLALQKNPESVRYAFTRDERTIYAVVPQATLEMFSDLHNYVTAITSLVVDSVKVKEALKSGVILDFATLERGEHVRIKQ